ncbi:MAG: hypothetical protein CBC35_09705 [Planctomycetes bacterium TMED75]|nr:hypothetical protein [Planctomycetaceae bacterium]OUU91380.1 MAG: hypothetical protein CBC35_09705 [Planctomycetes bacterium TMED75]
MRINVVIGAFASLPPAPAGAVEKVWAQLAASMAASGHEVTALCPAWGDLPATEEVDGVHYIRSSGFKRVGSTLRELPLEYRYARSMRRLLPPADVTVCNSFWMPVLLKKQKARFGLIDLHLQRFPKRQMFLYRKIDRISTVSEAIATAVRSQTPSVGHLLDVIPNPVDLEVYHPPEKRSDRARLEVLFHGRIHPEKGINVLIDATRIAQRLGVVFDVAVTGPHQREMGGGGDAYLSSLRTQAEGLPVRFESPVFDQHELADRLRRCDIHCYPSLAFHGEASPVAPVEAMACGAVPVVSDLPQFSGYARHMETALVFEREGSGAPERLAEALIKLVKDDALRDRLRSAALQQAQDLAVDLIAARHLEDWKRLQDQSQGGGG